MNAATDFTLDFHLVQRRVGQAARRGTPDIVAREIAGRMLERLTYIRHTPARILDLGCGTGADLEPLAQRYPHAERIGIDFAVPALETARGKRGFFNKLIGDKRGAPRFIGADAHALPLRARSVDLVWSNFLLNWLNDPLPALREMHRTLDVGGLLMFTTLGPDTLKELRACLSTHPGERVHRFIDMHDMGDCLVKAGFADPVMDMETLTLTYTSLDALLQDVRSIGAANASTARPRGLAGKTGWARARAAYEALRVEGRLPATVEVIYGHAWKATPRVIEDGRTIIHFDRSSRGGSP